MFECILYIAESKVTITQDMCEEEYALDTQVQLTTQQLHHFNFLKNPMDCLPCLGDGSLNHNMSTAPKTTASCFGKGTTVREWKDQ